jgi:nucleoside-diphosphate-sugar epimerase
LIIHAAGYAQPMKFLRDPVQTLKVHAALTFKLFERLMPHGKFLYLSSSEVLVGAKSARHTEHEIGTTTPEHVRGAYIQGKLCGEALVHAYRSTGINAKIARVSLVYGPGTKKDDERAVNTFIRSAITKKEINLLDSGLAGRTFLYVEDAVDILLNIALHGRQAIYNCGGISQTTILGLAHTIADICGDTMVTSRNGLDGVPGGPQAVALDMTRYQREFDEVNFTPLREGLERTIEWQRKNLYA